MLSRGVFGFLRDSFRTLFVGCFAVLYIGIDVFPVLAGVAAGAAAFYFIWGILLFFWRGENRVWVLIYKMSEATTFLLFILLSGFGLLSLLVIFALKSFMAAAVVAFILSLVFQSLWEPSFRIAWD